jgi:hypothetical protein
MHTIDSSISSVQLSTTVTVEELGVLGLKKIITIPYPHPAFGRVCFFIFSRLVESLFRSFFY